MLVGWGVGSRRMTVCLWGGGWGVGSCRMTDCMCLSQSNSWRYEHSTSIHTVSLID